MDTKTDTNLSVHTNKSRYGISISNGSVNSLTNTNLWKANIIICALHTPLLSNLGKDHSMCNVKPHGTYFVNVNNAQVMVKPQETFYSYWRSFKIANVKYCSYNPQCKRCPGRKHPLKRYTIDSNCYQGLLFALICYTQHITSHCSFLSCGYPFRLNWPLLTHLSHHI